MWVKAWQGKQKSLFCSRNVVVKLIECIVLMFVCCISVVEVL